MKLIMSSVTNDKDYRDVVKTKIVLAVVLIVLGIITFCITFLRGPILGAMLDVSQISYFRGIGTGLFVGGVVVAIMYGRLLRDNEKLRQHRIRNTDERVQSISRKAYVVAGFVLFAAIYLICIIGGLFNLLISKIMLLLIMVFLVSYFIAYRVIAARS